MAALQVTIPANWMRLEAWVVTSRALDKRLTDLLMKFCLSLLVVG